MAVGFKNQEGYADPTAFEALTTFKKYKYNASLKNYLLLNSMLY